MPSKQGKVVVTSEADLEVTRHGIGPALLFLHPHLGLWKSEPFIAALAKDFSVVAPSHPGFGGSKVHPDMTSVEDLSYLYLDLIEQWELANLTVVGSSLGGWIALAMATKNDTPFHRLVLLDSTGVHFGDAQHEDIVDVFSLSEEEFASRGFADPGMGKKDFKTMSDQELLVTARNREAAARYAWMPPFYDPKLRHRLHRVRCPSLLLWGDKDRITSEGYGQRMSAFLPQATYEVIPGAGHFPHIEQPAATARRIADFALG